MDFGNLVDQLMYLYVAIALMCTGIAMMFGGTPHAKGVLAYLFLRPLRWAAPYAWRLAKTIAVWPIIKSFEVFLRILKWQITGR